MSRTRIVGHRGASGLVPYENTCEAFTHTAEVGAGWVELDVRRLGDGTLVVLHDPVFMGTPLSHLTLDGLRARTADLGFEVPTLDQALACCAGTVRVDIELKELGTESGVARSVREHLAPGDYVYTSFYDRVIAGLKLLDPEAQAGLLLGHPNPESPLLTRLTELYPVQRLMACGADFAAPNWRLLRMGFLRRVRAAGYPIWVWTVNDEAQIRRLLHAEVDAVITDLPDLGVQLRQALQPAPALAPAAESAPDQSSELASSPPCAAVEPRSPMSSLSWATSRR